MYREAYNRACCIVQKICLWVFFTWLLCLVYGGIHDVLFMHAMPSLLPGNHMYLSARINGELVSRPYTPVTSDDEQGYFQLMIKVRTPSLPPSLPPLYL